MRLLDTPAGRHDAKLDLADVCDEVARRAGNAYEYEVDHWFSERAALLRDCSKVRVIPDPRCGGGAVSPMSCHVRGCPDCERARMAKLTERFEGIVTGFTAAPRRDAKTGRMLPPKVYPPMRRPALTTFSVPNAPLGGLAEAIGQLKRDWTRFRRRSIVKGGKCRWRWRDRGPTGELDGSPGHPCHAPAPAADCRPPRCAPGCPRAARQAYAEHLPACELGCPTRTGRRQSHCRTHPPAVTHPSGCPRGCPHHGHPKGRNCPDFAHAGIRAGVSALDLTWSERTGTWNQHLHALVDAPWLGWSELRDTWQAATCHREGCGHGWDPACAGGWEVWIEAVDVDDPERRQGAIREVLKYVGKPHGIVDSLDPDRVGEYLWALRNVRTIVGWGALHAIGQPEEEDDPDTVVIQRGFQHYRVPRHCPTCARPMEIDDWGWPYAGNRLAMVREGRRAWWPPGQSPEIAAQSSSVDASSSPGPLSPSQEPCSATTSNPAGTRTLWASA